MSSTESISKKFNLASERDLIPIVLGLRQGLKLQEQTIKKKTDEYSWSIATRITETLLKEISKTAVYYEYFCNNLAHKVTETLTYNEGGLVFSDTVITSIQRSNFEKFGMTKQEFIDDVNKAWRNDSVVPAIILAELTDWPDEEVKVNFILKLKA